MRALLALWLVGTLGAFWALGARYAVPVERPAGAATLRPETAPALPASQVGNFPATVKGQVTVLNFWNPTCPCSRFAQRHVATLVQEYSRRGVRFLTIATCEPGEAETTRKRWERTAISTPLVIDEGGAIARQWGAWAAPAAVVIDGHGKLAYVGAYNVSRYCDTRDTAYAQQAIEALLSQKAPPRASLPFYGCQTIEQK